MNKDIKPLYRKYNKRALHYRGNDPGGDFRHSRHTKEMKNFEGDKMSMKKTKGGYDYTPLFKFLLSKVGQAWNDVHKEAVSRLDKQEPIFWIVALHEHEKNDFVRIGESSNWSGLFVDEEGLLQKVKPELTINDFKPSCDCCTHSFNGTVLNK